MELVVAVVVMEVTLTITGFCCGLSDRIYGETATPAENAIIAMRTVVTGNRAFRDDNMLHEYCKLR